MIAARCVCKVKRSVARPSIPRLGFRTPPSKSLSTHEVDYIKARSHQAYLALQQHRNFSSTPTAKMQENVAKLYPNAGTSAKVMDYSIAHSTPLPEYLVKYHKWGCEETKMPNFLISTYQAQMLIFLARIVGVKNGELHFTPPPLGGSLWAGSYKT